MPFEFGDWSQKALFSLDDSQARLNIWQGSVSSGKTILTIVRWLSFVANAPKGRLLMVGKTERTLKRNVLDTLQDMVGDQNYKLNRSLGELRLFDRVIDLVGANDESSQDKIRGATYAGAYCDEITLYPLSFFIMLLSRLRVKGAKLFGTTNPDSPYHWFKTDYLENEKLNLNQYHFTLEDNLNLDPEYVENIKLEYTGLWYKRFILGEWVLAEGLVYDNFSEENNACEPEDLPKNYEAYYIANDYGTFNPFVLLLIGVHKGINYVIDEFYYCGRDEYKQKDTEEYKQDLIAFMGDRDIKEIFIDPSATPWITSLQKTYDLGGLISDVDNSVLDGVATVHRLFHQKKTIISKKCVNFLKELSTYSWDQKKSKKLGIDTVRKESDHGCDAYRYFAHTKYSIDNDRSGWF